MKDRKTVHKGDMIQTQAYGLVRFDGFDYYMGDTSVKLYSKEYGLQYPKAEREELQQYVFED